MPVRRVERVQHEEPEERLRERDLETGEIRELVDPGQEAHHDRDRERRLHDAHGQRARPARGVPDRERDRQADEHRDPQEPAARAFSQRRDGRRHHRDAGEHAERDDVLRLAHADAPPRRCTVAPAGKGPWAGLPTTARASRRPTCSGVGTTPRRGPSTSAVESSTLRTGAQRVVGHPRRTRRDELGVGAAQIDDQDHDRSARTLVLAHHDRARPCGRGPVDRADRIAVEVLPHAAGELGAAGCQVGELGRGLGVADDDRTAGGLPSRGHVDRRGEVDRDPATPTGQAEWRGGDDLDA